MTPEAMIQFVDDLYAATGVGDFEKAAEILTDDFFVSEAAGLPMAGVYRGKYALRDLYRKVMALVDVAGLDRVQTRPGPSSSVFHAAK